ncbi:MAG: hypothetical protein ACJ8AO_00920 [Gemmatimonadaceae bacterium]
MRSLLATLAAFSLASIAGAQAMTTRSDRPDTARVVFVCEHGAAKSVVAAALFNRMAAERGLAAQAVARGTEPDTVIPAHVRDGLRADGADIGDARPQGLGAADGRGARLFVAFDVEVPAAVAGGAPVRRWDGTPSVMRGYDLGRDSIRVRVAELIAELDGAAPPAARPHP